MLILGTLSKFTVDRTVPPVRGFGMSNPIRDGVRQIRTFPFKDYKLLVEIILIVSLSVNKILFNCSSSGFNTEEILCITNLKLDDVAAVLVSSAVSDSIRSRPGGFYISSNRSVTGRELSACRGGARVL